MRVRSLFRVAERPMMKALILYAGLGVLRAMLTGYMSVPVGNFSVLTYATVW